MRADMVMRQPYLPLPFEAFLRETAVRSTRLEVLPYVPRKFSQYFRRADPAKIKSGRWEGTARIRYEFHA